jgi:hypothetical protein
MEKSFQEAMELRLRQNFGPSRFSTFMIRHIAECEDINLEELIELIDKFKYHNATYALFPFVYTYLNVDVYELYKKLANENDWIPEKVKIQLDPSNTYILPITEKLGLLNYFEESDRRLQEISSRLIKEGAPLAQSLP